VPRRSVDRPGFGVLAAIGLLALGLLAAETAHADRGGYDIRSFDTDITVEVNSDVLVEERLEVFFSEPRHGIYRTIPVRYSDPRGYAYSLDLRLLGVTDESGEAHGTKLSNEGRYVNIRIGDADRTVEGRVVYVIRYRVRDALGRFPEHDEIYWNATGNEWNASIERSSATVRLPGRIAAEDIEAAGYTGRFGSDERAVEISHPEPGAVRFVATRPFEPLEGLTVAVGFAQGLVKFPSPLERVARVVADNWIILLPFGWFALLLGRYRGRGRDPEPGGPVMVQYEPPAGLSPGGVGTLVDERVDLVDITATVVDLAIRRHLTISTEEKEHLFGLIQKEETVFRREPAGRGDLAPHERAVMDALFAAGDTVRTSDLTNKFYASIPGIQAALYRRLVDDRHFVTSPEKTRGQYVGWGFLAALLTGLFGAAWMAFRGVAPPAGVAVPLLTGVLTWIMFAAFSPAMPRRTEAGARARHWALGFQEFARRVEGDRLDRAAADPRQTFETLLPYAMALGVGGEWAKKFEGIYDQAAPAWYVGHHVGRGFSTHAFEQSLSSAMSRTSQSMTASPRSSSGSGGGGSSGGGGGGGGGGSW
jgi:uncharacterized membrane protein YgcG